METGFTPASISRANSSSVLHADLSSAVNNERLFIIFIIFLYEDNM